MIAVVVLVLTAATTGRPELSVVVEPSEVRVGDRVTATLTLEASPEATGLPAFPAWPGTWGPGEVLASSPPFEDNGVWRQRLELAFFAPGEHTLPAPAVEVPTVGGALTARPARPTVVHVRSVLAPDQRELEPAAPPRPLPLGRPFAWTTGALAAAIATTTLFAFWRHRRAFAAAEVEALLPSLEQLRRSLAALSGQGDPEAAWVGLSLALRRYLGARLEFPAAESTTSEIQRALLRDPFPAELSGDLVRILRTADQVKFARHAAAAASVSTHLVETLRLAERVDAVLQPPAPAAEAA